MSISAENIPTLLRELPFWVGWKLEEREGKLTKPPYQLDGETKASTTDPDTWCSFPEALAAAEGGAVAGVGFVFPSDSIFVGIDLDKVRHPDTGEIAPYYLELVRSIPTYWEVSPSGTGLHGILKGSLPEGWRRKTHLGIEMYQTGRYFTMTGERIDGARPEIERCDQALERFRHQVDLDEACLKRCMPISKFKRLFSGDIAGYPSHSEADQAFANIVALHTTDQDRTAQVHRIMRLSKLYRPKWNELHGRGTYGAMTVEKALSWATTQEIAPRAEETSLTWESTEREPRFFIEVFADFERRVETKPKPKALMGDLIVEKAHVLVHGQPREGKTLTMEEIATSLTTATDAFELERFHVSEPVPTLFVHEEDPEERVLERFQWFLAGRGITKRPDALHMAVQRRLDLDDPEWWQALTEASLRLGIKATCFDPLRALSGCVDGTPKELKPLGDFFRHYVQDTGSAILAVHHDTKPKVGVEDTRKKPQRASGGGIFSIMDSPIHVAKFGYNQSLALPSGFKHSADPQPFSFQMAFVGDPVVTLRLIGKSTHEESAEMLEAEEKIRRHLTEHPDSSTNSIAKAIGKKWDQAKALLDFMARKGIVTSRPGARRGENWSLSE